MSDNIRIIEVERKFYVELLKHLMPVQRWRDPEHGGIVLFAYDYETGESTRLVFKKK